MTRPLIVVLQLIGFFLIVFGLPSQAWGHVAFGLALVVIGGMQYRKRVKERKAQAEALQEIARRGREL